MTHLSQEDIIKYVTANKLNNETLEVLSKVNAHIRVCSSCKEALEAYESVNDEFKKLATEKDFCLNHTLDSNEDIIHGN